MANCLGNCGLTAMIMGRPLCTSVRACVVVQPQVRLAVIAPFILLAVPLVMSHKLLDTCLQAVATRVLPSCIPAVSLVHGWSTIVIKL